MVGVPRSSGCRICVQRRVRCDGTRPICNNCKKGNRPCPGYGPGVKFQDEGPRLREKYQKKQNMVTDSDSTTTDEDALSLSLTPSSVNSIGDAKTPKQWNILGIDIDPDSNEGARRMNLFGFVEGKTKEYSNFDIFSYLYDSPTFLDSGWEAAVADSPGPLSMITAPVMSPAAQQSQLLATFTHAITPPESSTMPKAMRGQANWLSQIPDFTGAHQLLDSAVRAVTLVHIGRIHKNETFIMESRPYYGKALRLLSGAVGDKEMGMDNRTLCATILLSFYEMFASDDEMSWVRHAGGAGTLMRMRGAKRHRYGFDRDIFLAYRHTLVIEAMANDIPSFLDEPEWRELTKQIHNDLIATNQIPPERVVIFDVVEDFFSQMAAISTTTAAACHLNDKIQERGLDQDDDPLAVYEMLRSHHADLVTLFKKWNVIVGVIGHSPPLVPTSDPVITAQYKYTNVFIASFFVGFWTTTMLVNSNMFFLAEYLGYDTAPIVSENEDFSLECCRSVDFMIQSSFLGPFFTIYALRFAFRVFKPGDIRSDWALCKLIEIGDKRMMFAKAAIGGGPQGSQEKPELYFEGARQRLAQHAMQHQLLNGIGGQM